MRKRRKIKVGEYQIGDEIFGKKITSFGKAWTEKVADESYFQGELWEECRCGSEPCYLPYMLCANCINRKYGESEETFCYAYFE